MGEMSSNLVMNIGSNGNEFANQNWFEQQFNENKLFPNSNLNFTSAMANTPEDDISSQRKKPSSRDPLSHRIIEKRRRDRMNNCLADLSRLIPTSYLKKGRGRIEKTEIIEMAIKYMKHLQAHKFCEDDTKCDLSHSQNLDHEQRIRQYRLGYQECLSEAIRFLVEIEGLFTGDGLCRRMMDYLHTHMTTLQNVSSCNEPEVSAIPLTCKARSPSLSESTTSANEKMDINDSDSSDRSFNCKPVVTSHLREMLESSTKRKLSPNTSLSSGSPSLSPNNCHQTEVYNFKKEIKDRYKADQKILEEPFKSISPLNAAIDDERISNSSLSSLTTQLSDHRSDTSGYSSNSSNKSLMPSVVVPVFALHPCGQFYLPLTVEASLIAPYITKESGCNPFPILHPINITVNFSYQMPHQLDYSRPDLDVKCFNRPVLAQNLNLSATQMPKFINNTSNDNDNNSNTTGKANGNNNYNNNTAVQQNSRFDKMGSNSLNIGSKCGRLNKTN